MESEKFQILSELGSGGFAVTYQARVLDEDLRNELGQDVVVLKVPHRQMERVLKEEIENNAALFVRLRRIASINIVRYLGFDLYSNKIVMIMEYCKDGNLRRLVGDSWKPGTTKRHLPFDQTLNLITGILRGLDVIHAEGILHRDIKPENILMDGGVPKIGDMGLSRFLSAPDAVVKSFAGSFLYMAPEIYGEEGATLSADIWAVGVVFYELLTGHWPFGPIDSVSQDALIRRIRTQDPPPPSRLVELPANIDAVVAKALQKRPQDRYHDAKEFLQDLGAKQKKEAKDLPQALRDLRVMLETGITISKVEGRLKEIIQQYPDSVEPLEFMGELYIRGQRYREAVEVYKQAAEADKANPMLYWNLATAYERLGEYNKAFIALQRAMRIGLDPSLQRHAMRWRQAIEDKCKKLGSGQNAKR
jgi:serine/threonine protein kinase